MYQSLAGSRLGIGQQLKYPINTIQKINLAHRQAQVYCSSPDQAKATSQASNSGEQSTANNSSASQNSVEQESQQKEQVLQVDISQAADKARKAALSTLAPKQTFGKVKKNPAQPGTLLYKFFTYQAWICAVIGGFVVFDLLFPSTEKLSVWKACGMWSVWLFTIPSLRARDCSKKEKRTLDTLFLLQPLTNCLIPVFFKPYVTTNQLFIAVYISSMVEIVGFYLARGLWQSPGSSEENEPESESEEE